MDALFSACSYSAAITESGSIPGAVIGGGVVVGPATPVDRDELAVNGTPVCMGETCGDALEEPLAEIGLEVEVCFAPRDAVLVASGVL